jgi:hypothetical protein
VGHDLSGGCRGAMVRSIFGSGRRGSIDDTQIDAIAPDAGTRKLERATVSARVAGAGVEVHQHLCLLACHMHASHGLGANKSDHLQPPSSQGSPSTEMFHGRGQGRARDF